MFVYNSMRRALSYLIAGLLTVVGCGGQMDRIRPQKITEHLTEDDKQTNDGYYYDAYWFRALDTQRVTVELKSDEFDPYVEIYDEDGHSMDKDDDSGSGNNAKARFTASFNKYYKIIVTTHDAAEKGYYTLTVSKELQFDSTITRGK